MACDYFQRKKKAVQIDRAGDRKNAQEAASEAGNSAEAWDDRALLKQLLDQEKKILSGTTNYPHSLPRR